MKKIIYAGAFLLTCTAATISHAQMPEFSATSEKRELKQEKKLINSEERGIRREEKAMRHSEVSYMTREQFKLDFPQANNPSFYSGRQFDEVFYTQEGQHFTAYYDATSNLVGTTTIKQLGDIPKDAREKIERHYLDKGYSLKRIILYTDNQDTATDMWLYESPFDDTDAYFVELQKDGRTTVLQANMDGEVSTFKRF